MAGNISYLAPVDNASGKIFGQKQKFVAVKRNWGNRQRGCSVSGERDLKNHPLTDKEKAIRARFTSVSASTRERMLDPTKMQADQNAFKAQSKYKTFYRFIWNMEWAAYEA
jgi:hypothetical protein